MFALVYVSLLPPFKFSKQILLLDLIHIEMLLLHNWLILVNIQNDHNSLNLLWFHIYGTCLYYVTFIMKYMAGLSCHGRHVPGGSIGCFCLSCFGFIFEFFHNFIVFWLIYHYNDKTFRFLFHDIFYIVNYTLFFTRLAQNLVLCTFCSFLTWDISSPKF